MEVNMKTVWDSILCGLGSLLIVSSIFMYMSLEDEKEIIKLMESMVSGIDKSMSQLVGGTYKSPKLNVMGNDLVQNAIADSELRILSILILGIFMSVAGSVLLSNRERNT